MGKLLLACTFAVCAFAQSDRGSLTGTVSDPTGAVVPNVNVVATSAATAAQYPTVTTPTGNYTLASLPSGSYRLEMDAPGFKKFIQLGIKVDVAQTQRVDVTLAIGNNTESVTITADATLLKTDSGEQSHNITGDRINALPLNYGALGGTVGGELRNPYAFVSLAPGATISGSSSIRVNGMPSDSETILLEGQESTNSLQPGRPDEVQPSVEAVQEISMQTSNFAAEYGQVAGGVFNFTTKSGTNQFHGSAYEHWTNEDLNAGVPFTNSGNGHLIRPRSRTDDYGFSVGGPVFIPKLYDGRNRSFFFIGYEKFRQASVSSATFATLPTDAMRNGDFSGILTGKTLGTDPLGRPIVENAIYDPSTARAVNGLIVTDPFPGNKIPVSKFDPVAAKIQALIPRTTNAAVTNNFQQIYATYQRQFIPSIKLDQIVGAKQKVSFYYANFSKDQSTLPDGLPIPITSGRTNAERDNTVRLNYDYTISPTLLLHAGGGFLKQYAPDKALAGVMSYDAVAGLGFVGGTVTGFPRITGLNASLGGSSLNFGPSNFNHYYLEKPTAVVNATWVRNSHTYKAGADFRIDAFTDRNSRGSTGILNFSATETGLPSTLGQNLNGGAVGFPYASFLLGAVDNASVSSPQDPQLRKQSWALFVQDNWKMTQKLTLDYGLRWDYQTSMREIHDRLAVFDPNRPNPSAGGLPGATSYAGYGPGRCNCDFAPAYPYAIGPRLGMAYQIDAKTVLRAGWGLTYGTTAQYNFITGTSIIGVGFNNFIFTPPAYGTPALYLQNGLPYDHSMIFASSLNPGIRPDPGQTDNPPYLIDKNGGRPSRINQWSIGLQRELSRNIVVEAAYVGNRGAWEQADSLVDLNALTPQRIASFGLDITKPSDQSLLTAQMNSPQVIAAGFKVPYAGFPVTSTLAQALRPFPQFTSVPVQWAPLGHSWYDSLQAKATQRLTHGLNYSVAFTWAKQLISGASSQNGSTAVPVNDVFNRANLKELSASDQPFVLSAGINYQLPAITNNRWIRSAARDWTAGAILQYGSGLPILAPYSNNGLNALLLRNTGSNPATFANRVPGQPLFTHDLNCHCFDPNTTFVLNPAAWTDPPKGQFGTSAPYYTDYRYERRPQENLSLGRIFRFRESLSLQIRAEFFNAFNRTYLNNPTATNAAATQVIKNGQASSGFGFINTGTTFALPRRGQLVARFQW